MKAIMLNILAAVFALLPITASAQGPVFNAPPSQPGCRAGQACTGTTITATTAFNVGDSTVVINKYADKQVRISGDGTGATTNAGWIGGYGGSSNYSAWWLSSLSYSGSGLPTAASGYTSAILYSDASGVNLQAPTATGVVDFGQTTAAGAQVLKMRVNATAGAGPSITAGTAATDVAALSVTRTNNNAAVATGVKFTFTDTTSAAGFLPFQILGGPSATTNLFSVDKTGGFVAPGAAIVLSGLGASTGTPSSLCMNGTTVTVNAALTCTVSSRDYKTGIEPFKGSGLAMVAMMEPDKFFYRDNLSRERLGFMAEDMAKIDPRLAEWSNGKPNSIDFAAIAAVQAKAIQEIDARLNRAGL